jgi:hypothetical protein
MALSQTIAKLFDTNLGTMAFKAQLAQRLRSLQQGLVSGQTAPQDFGFDPNSIQVGALAFGTVSTTTSATAGTQTTVTANVIRQPQLYFIVSGNGYIVSMTYSNGVATFTVASSAASQNLTIGYLY